MAKDMTAGTTIRRGTTTAHGGGRFAGWRGLPSKGFAHRQPCEPRPPNVPTTSSTTISSHIQASTCERCLTWVTGAGAKCPAPVVPEALSCTLQIDDHRQILRLPLIHLVLAPCL